MKIYPGIYKGKDGGVRFYFSESTFCFNDSSAFEDWIADENKNEHKKDKNITAEYLANTYGEVRSKEHAEFIVKLADSAGFAQSKTDVDLKNAESFVFYIDRTLSIYDRPHCNLPYTSAKKLITIPLPPKEKSMGSQKEWPQVGDKVLTDSKEVVEVVAIDNDMAWLKHSFCETKYGYLSMRIKMLSKAPTPEEDLRAKLISVMDKSNTAFTYADFISKAIINGEIEGLEYKHD